VDQVKIPGSDSWRSRLLQAAGVDAQRAALLGKVAGRAAAAAEALQPRLKTLRELRDTWGGHPLWFLLRNLPMAQAATLLRLVDEAGEEVVVDLLQPVITRSALTVLIAEELLFVPVELSPALRRQIGHGLEHAQAAEWEEADPPLVLGLQELNRRSRAAADGAREPGAAGGAPLPARREQVRYRAARPYAQKVAEWTRSALDQTRVSRSYDVDADARRQAIFLVCELVRWLERQGRTAASAYTVRALAISIQSERDRRRGASLRPLPSAEEPRPLPPASDDAVDAELEEE
jgi:hypothetical protein